MALTEGQLIAGKYRVLRLLGEGGMGAVYVAVNERLRKEVALKVLGDELASDEEQAARFVREAMSASAVKHPGIVEIYDADSDDGLFWIAMEKLEGESLADRLERGPLAADQVFVIMTQVVSALAAVHAVGVVHRDLKPGNIFLERLATGEERAKILDFGIAKASFEGMDKITRTGMTVGTPDYLAPEQAMGGSAIDARTDIYAVGVILFEALSGAMPYDATSFGELVAQMIQQGPKNLAAVAPQLAQPITSLVTLCLSVSADDRPQTAEALHREMQRLQQLGIKPTMALVQAGVPSATPPLGAWPPTPVAKTAAMVSGAAPMLSAPIAAATPGTNRGPLVLVLGAVAGLGVVAMVVLVTVLIALVPRDEEPAQPGVVVPPGVASPGEPEEPAGCETNADCSDPLRENCDLQTHECTPSTQWSDTRLTYADLPEIHHNNCRFCDATLTPGRHSSLLLRFQQGGGYLVWSLTLPGDIEPGTYQFRRGLTPSRGPYLGIAESSPEISARYRGMWNQSAGTLVITEADIRYGGVIAGTIRADLFVPRTDPPVTGAMTSTFRAEIPE